MQSAKDCTMTTELTVEKWRAIRKEEGLKIDPSTAEVYWTYTQVLDPYGIYGEPPEGCDQIGRAHFARRPGSDMWVEFGDLPKATLEALRNRDEGQSAFAAGFVLDEDVPI